MRNFLLNALLKLFLISILLGHLFPSLVVAQNSLSGLPSLEEITLGNVAQLELLMNIKVGSPVWEISTTMHGENYLVFGSADGKIHVWRFSASPNTHTTFEPCQVERITLSSDGRTLALTCFEAIALGLFNIETEEWIRFIQTDDALSAVAFSPDNRWITTSYSPHTFVWDVETGKKVKDYVVESDMPWAIMDAAFSPIDPTIAVAGWYGVRVWNLESNELIDEFGWQVNKIAFSADGKRIAYLTDDSRVYLTGLYVDIQYTADILTTALTFNLDGSILIGAGEVVYIWDTTTGENIETLDTSTSARIDSVAITPDGKLLVCSDSEGNMTLWGIPEEDG